MFEHGLSRRYFFYGALAGAVPLGGFGTIASLKAMGYTSPNEKVNLAGIGAGAQGFLSIAGAAGRGGENNVVALADVDLARGTQGFAAYPKAEKYQDYRQMLEKQGKNIDAVTIGIPDHMHAHACLTAMQLGKHVYCQKPLTRTAGEARWLTQAAAKYPNVATQMGNQGYSHEATRVACEILWSGEIGDVTEVHAMYPRTSWPQEMLKIPPPTKVPDTLNWDLWLGTAAWRPFTDGDQEYFDFVAARNARNARGGGPAPGGGRGDSIPTGAPGASVQTTGAYNGGFYLPFNWRGFYDFGSSLIGDWGVHILGPANWGLQLDPKYLISVECVSKDMLPPFSFPDEFVLRYEFGPRPGMPPVTIYWHQGGNGYLPPGMTAEQARKIPGTGPTLAGAAGRGAFGGGRAGAAPGVAAAPGGQAAPGGAVGGATPGGGAGRFGGQPQGSGYNCIFVGSKGYMGTNGRGEDVGLLPGSRWAEYKLPTPLLTRSPGHAQDWIRACKGGAPACSNFSIAGPYTEWLVSGSAAVHTEGKLMWDNAKGEFAGASGQKVRQWIKPTYRKGWEVKV